MMYEPMFDIVYPEDTYKPLLSSIEKTQLEFSNVEIYKERLDGFFNNDITEE